MPLLNAVLILVVADVILWLINTCVLMQGTIKSLLDFVSIAAVVTWLLAGFGIINGGGDGHMLVVQWPPARETWRAPVSGSRGAGQAGLVNIIWSASWRNEFSSDRSGIVSRRQGG